MTTFLSILLFLVVLEVLILVHELGHFWAAKKAGAVVEEFGLGFPPRLFRYRHGETIYSFNLIPFGGFVKIAGENPFEEEATNIPTNRLLNNLPRLSQFKVLFAGVFFNWLFAWALLAIGLIIGLPVSSENPGFKIDQISAPRLLVTNVSNGSPAFLAGIKPGDEIISLSRSDRKLIPKKASQVGEFVQESPNSKINLAIKTKAGDLKNYSLSPKKIDNQTKPQVGLSLEMVSFVKLPIVAAPLESFRLTLKITTDTFDGLRILISRLFADHTLVEGVSGPVGLVGLVGGAAAMGLPYLLLFVAIISVNLAVMNLIPIPALDGGRLLFLIAESVSNKKINPRLAGWLNLAGFLALILLMVIVTYFDVKKLW